MYYDNGYLVFGAIHQKTTTQKNREKGIKAKVHKYLKSKDIHGSWVYLTIDQITDFGETEEVIWRAEIFNPFYKDLGL